MNRRVRTVLVVALFAALVSGTARAQAPRERIGVRGFVTLGATTLSPTRTFEAVAGTSRDLGFGFGAEVVNLWRSVFAGVSTGSAGLDGERVWSVNGTIYKLGIPLEISVRPVDLVGGWRLGRGRVRPFAAAGASLVSYKEASQLAASGDDVDERKTGFVILGGADFALHRWFHVGGELRYRAVSGILGHGGVSQTFDDTTLGGLSAAMRIVVGR